MKLRIEYMTDKHNEKIFTCKSFRNIEDNAYSFYEDSNGEKIILYVQNLVVLERLKEEENGQT